MEKNQCMFERTSCTSDSNPMTLCYAGPCWKEEISSLEKKPGSFTIVGPTPANPLNNMIIKTLNVIRKLVQRRVIRKVEYLYENHSKAWSNRWHNWNYIKRMTI
jgi:hypothetical protein